MNTRTDHEPSDYDLWVDGDLSPSALSQLAEQLDESFVPFTVDIVTTPQLNGRFAERVKQEATLWMLRIKTFQEATAAFAYLVRLDLAEGEARG